MIWAAGRFLIPKIRFRVVCSKGTYIRTLAHDLGVALGCGASLHALERTRIGQFWLKDALSLEQLAQLEHYAERTRLLIPLAQVLAFLPAIVVSERAAWLLMHGSRIALTAENCPDLRMADEQNEEQRKLRVYTAAGQLIALARKTCAETPTGPQWLLQPLKVLVKVANA